MAFEQAEYLQVLDRGRLRALCTDGHGHRGVATLRSLLAGPPCRWQLSGPDSSCCCCGSAASTASPCRR
jgi:hypothetical protein